MSIKCTCGDPQCPNLILVGDNYVIAEKKGASVLLYLDKKATRQLIRELKKTLKLKRR